MFRLDSLNRTTVEVPPRTWKERRPRLTLRGRFRPARAGGVATSLAVAKQPPGSAAGQPTRSPMMPLELATTVRRETVIAGAVRSLGTGGLGLGLLTVKVLGALETTLPEASACSARAV
jgi:hypothetical protein